MLTIRREQMKVFEVQREADFRRRLHAHARKLLNDARREISDEELTSQLTLGLARGRRFFRAETDLARYVEVVLTKLGGWDPQNDHPEAALQMLRAPGVQPQTRLDNFARWIAWNKAVSHAG